MEILPKYAITSYIRNCTVIYILVGNKVKMEIIILLLHVKEFEKLSRGRYIAYRYYFLIWLNLYIFYSYLILKSIKETVP